MNKLLRLTKLFALLVFLLAGASTAWADEVVLQYTTNATKNMTGGNDAATVGLSATDWSVVGAKGSSQNYPGLNKAGNIRLYAGAKTDYTDGNTLTVTALNSNYTINSITVDYLNVSTPVVSVGGTAVTGTNSGKVYTYTINSTEFVIKNSPSTNTQCQINKITINYTAGETGGKKTANPTISATTTDTNNLLTVAMPEDFDGTLTLSSDNTDVAVVSGANVQGIASGTANITASWDETETYKEGSKVFAITVVKIEHAGTEADPYTVADARGAVALGTGVTGVYAKGIVSRLYSTSVNANGQISYYISEDGQTTSPELEAYNGLNIGGAAFTAIDDIQVGDEVVIYGNLKKYQTTYEFDSNNQLISLNRETPAVEKPTLTPSATSAETGESVTITVSQPDFDGDAARIYYTTDGSDPTTSATRGELADSGENQIVVTMANADIVVNAVAQKYGSTDYSSVASVTITYISNEAKTLPYEVDLLSAATGQSDFTFEQTTPTIWTWSSSYGAVGTSKAKVDAEGWLISPLISLEGATAPVVTWDEVLKFFGTVDEETSVWVREGTSGEWETLTIPTRDDNGSNWTYTSVGDNDLSAYIGKTIQIGFKYVSSTDAYGTWEIKNFSVTDKTTPAVDTPVLTPSATSAETGSDVTITVSQTDFDSDAGQIWYTTDGTDPKTSSTKQVLDDSTVNTITVTMADADIVVKAVATTDGGTTFSDEASVTISLIKVYTIKSINDACDPSVTTSTDIATHVRLQFTDAVVVDKIPGSSNNNLFIREGSYAICLFAHTSEQIVGTTLTVGDKLNGWIEGTVCNYKGIPEFKTTSATTIDNLTVEGGQTVTPRVFGTDYSSIENFNNRADLISIEGTITKDGTRYYLDTDGIQLYEPGVFATNLLGALENDADWATYTFRVTGPVAAIYGGKPEIYVRKVEIKLDTTRDSHENVSRMSMYYGNYNLVPAEGQWIETYNVNSGSKTLTRNAWYNHTGETAAIAKGTGFLTWTSASQTYWQIVEDSYTNFHEADANNILTGTDYIQGITTDPNYYYFVLTYYDPTDKEGTLGFYFPVGTGETQLAGGSTVFENGAHKAYAVVPVADVPAGVAGFSFNDGAVTGIDGINADIQNSADGAVYTLSGVRVQNAQSLPKGIYVKNGKKVVVK